MNHKNYNKRNIPSGYERELTTRLVRLPAGQAWRGVCFSLYA